jgi:site-specific DNA recombinase
LLEIESYFRQHGATLHSIDGKLDTSSAQGRMFFGLSGILAEWEAETIAARVSAAALTRAREGKRTSGQQPFGYEWKNNDEMTVDPEKSVVVRKAFDLFVQHQKIMAVCTILNDAGYRAAKSNWTIKTMKRLLTTELYATGIYIRNYTKSQGDKKSWRLKPESEWIKSQVEPIIPQELYDTVQSILNNRTQQYSTGVPKEGKYLFSGVLVCPECNKKLYVTPYKGMAIPKYVCGTCRNSILEDVLMSKFLPVLQSVIIKPELLVSVNDNDELLAKRSSELEVLKSDKTKTKKSIDKLFELYTDDRLTKALFTERHNPLQTHYEQLETEIGRLETEIALLRQEEIGRQHIVREAQTLAVEWLDLKEDDRRRIVRMLLDHVDIGCLVDGRRSLKFVFSFDPQEVFNNLPPTGGDCSKRVARPHGFIAATSITLAG